QYDRYGSNFAGTNDTNFGKAMIGLNWTPVTLGNGSLNTLNAADWQSSHSYTCSASVPCVIGPLLNNAGSYNFYATANCVSSGTEPNPWQQTHGTTQADGT